MEFLIGALSGGVIAFCYLTVYYELRLAQQRRRHLSSLIALRTLCSQKGEE